MQLLKEWRKTIGYYSIFAAVPAMLAGGSQDLRANDSSQGNQPATITTSGSDDCPGTAIPAGSYTVASPYVDNGDTTGANDTVTRMPYYCYYYYCYYNDSHGPDRVYSFVVTNSGPNASITVSTNSPSYRPMVYVTSGCPTGQGNTGDYPWAMSDSRSGAGNTAAVNLSGLPPGRRYYLFIDAQMAGDAGPYTVTVKDMQISTALPVRSNAPDFDGDGKADLSVYRPSDSTWYIDRSSQGVTATQFGIPTDKVVPADYDGDGKTDIAVFRDGDWWILKSSDSTPEVIRFGQAGDIPLPADYTGDGRADIAVYRNGEWWIYDIVTGKSSTINFGLSTDKPVPGDYTGDGRAEIAVFRDGDWWLYNLATGQYSVINFGQAGDRPVPGNYNGDDHIIPAVYRDGTWKLYGYSNDFRWGLSTDVPVPADYDGDGQTDFGIYRDGVWWIMQRGTGQMAVKSFGLSNDDPAPAANLR